MRSRRALHVPFEESVGTATAPSPPPQAARTRVIPDFRHWYTNFRSLLQISDAIAIALSLAVSFWLRFGGGQASRVDDLIALVLVGTTWMVSLSLTESRDKKVLAVGLEEYRRVITSSLYAFGALAICSYLFKVEPSRFVFVMALPLGIAALLTSRWLLRVKLTRARRDGRASVPTILVGSQAQVGATERDLLRYSELGLRPAAAVYTDAGDGFAAASGLPHITRADAPALVAAGHYGAVVVTDGVAPNYSRGLAWALERHAVEILFVSELFDLAGPRMTVQTMEGFDLVHIDLPRLTGWPLHIKRVFDFTFSSAALILLSPLFLLIALAIKLDDHGPVIFRQKRIGLNGAEFTIHKFRTMRTDAESHLEELRAESIGNVALFKLDRDPRVTRIGRLLRTYSLDELPQFWTVLRGRMSVVGPRPHLAKELAGFPDEGLRRLLIKPGITGLWQISGRSDLSLEDSVKLDLRYIESWSLTGDIVVVLKTLKAVFTPRGAY